MFRGSRLKIDNAPVPPLISYNTIFAEPGRHTSILPSRRNSSRKSLTNLTAVLTSVVTFRPFYVRNAVSKGTVPVDSDFNIFTPGEVKHVLLKSTVPSVRVPPPNKTSVDLPGRKNYPRVETDIELVRLTLSSRRSHPRDSTSGFVYVVLMRAYVVPHRECK